MSLIDHVRQTLREIEAEGLLKREREIATPQGARIEVESQGRRRPILIPNITMLSWPTLRITSSSGWMRTLFLCRWSAQTSNIVMVSSPK